jgi:hypothetical protein
MRAFEWETKGVSRTLNPSTAAMRAWPFSRPDKRSDRESGAPKAEKTASNATEKPQERDAS